MVDDVENATALSNDRPSHQVLSQGVESSFATNAALFVEWSRIDIDIVVVIVDNHIVYVHLSIDQHV